MQKVLTEEDIVIVAGDFGFIWDGCKSDKYWLKWLEKKKDEKKENCFEK